jgi:hypothetical protein
MILTSLDPLSRLHDAARIVLLDRTTSIVRAPSETVIHSSTSIAFQIEISLHIHLLADLLFRNFHKFRLLPTNDTSDQAEMSIDLLAWVRYTHFKDHSLQWERCYLDGEKMVEQAEGPPSGRIGLMLLGTSSAFDDIVVYDAGGPSVPFCPWRS